MKSDYEIAQETILQPITAIAGKIGLPKDLLIPYGHYKAKIQINKFDEEKVSACKLVLVTAITPTKAGVGKTTTSVGLTDGLNKLNKKADLPFVNLH